MGTAFQELGNTPIASTTLFQDANDQYRNTAGELDQHQPQAGD